jgi:hypothetical protein
VYLDGEFFLFYFISRWVMFWDVSNFFGLNLNSLVLKISL